MNQILDFLATCERRLNATDRINMRALLMAASLDSTDPLPIHNLARECRRRGYSDLWRNGIEIALAMPHFTAKQFFRRASAKLTLDEWSGWDDREVRLLDPDMRLYRDARIRRMQWSKLAWNGKEDLSDQTIFVIGDGGYGDGIQMLRFAPALAHVAAKVILSVRRELVSLAEHNCGNAVRVVCQDDEQFPSFEWYTWNMSLPALFGAIPPFVPLTAPHPIVRSNCRPRRLQIGVCWAGNPNHPMDCHRSLPLELLAPLFLREAIEWHSLQAGARAADAAAFNNVLPPVTPLTTFADTANVMTGLDCVVTVDTAVAHLAGSLGVPTLLLLSFASEYRWGLHEKTPWYPSMRLVRQHRPDEWGAVIDAVIVDLDARVAAHMI